MPNFSVTQKERCLSMSTKAAIYVKAAIFKGRILIFAFGFIDIHKLFLFLYNTINSANYWGGSAVWYKRFRCK